MEKIRLNPNDYGRMSPCVFKDRGGDLSMILGIRVDGSIMTPEDLLQDHYSAKPPYHVRIQIGKISHSELKCFMSIRTRDHQVVTFEAVSRFTDLTTNKSLTKCLIRSLSVFDSMTSRGAAAIQSRIEDGMTEIDYDILQNNEKQRQLAIPVVYDVDAAMVIHSTWRDGNTNVGLSTNPFSKPTNVAIVGVSYAEGDEDALNTVSLSVSDDSLFVNADRELIGNPIRAMQLARDCFEDTANVVIYLGKVYGAFYKKKFPEDFVEEKSTASPIILG